MIEFLVAARAALAQVHPSLPFLVTAAIVGSLVWLWKKVHAKSFDGLPTGLKAIPGLVIAGLLSAMSTDGPILTVIVDAVIGGFTAAGGHHALKDISWLPYGNPPKEDAPKPPVLPLLLLLVAALALGNSGCASAQEKAKTAQVDAECAAVRSFFKDARKKLIKEGGCSGVSVVGACIPYVTLRETYLASLKRLQCPTEAP
jgi:hypothetical protein